LWALTTVWWQLSWVFLFNTSDPQKADLIVRVGYSGITLIPIAYYAFIVSLCQWSEKRFVIAGSFFLGIVFLVLLWTSDLFINGHFKFSWGYYPKAGPLHPVFLLFLSYLAIKGLYVLHKTEREGAKRSFRAGQIRYIYLAAAAYCISASDFFVNYGVDFYPLGVIPVGAAFLLILTYAAIRFYLIDFRLATRYFLSYFILGCAFAVPVFALMFLIRSWIVATVIACVVAGTASARILLSVVARSDAPVWAEGKFSVFVRGVGGAVWGIEAGAQE
jgi:hypothetical protein